MSVLDALRRLRDRITGEALRRRLEANLAEPVMHRQAGFAQPACGVDYGPANLVTIEPERVTCEKCRAIGDRWRLRRVLRDR